MTGTQWNIGLSVFCTYNASLPALPALPALPVLTTVVITYALGGPPSNLALKKFGPKRVLPIILLCVSFVLIGSGCANNFSQWIALRMRTYLASSDIWLF